MSQNDIRLNLVVWQAQNLPEITGQIVEKENLGLIFLMNLYLEVR